MANPYAAMRAYQTPGRVREAAWEAAEKTRTGARAKRKEMKDDFKVKAEQARIRAEKALARARRKAKRRGKFGKLFKGVMNFVPGAGKIIGKVGGALLDTHNAYKTAKDTKKYLKQAGGFEGFKGTFLEDMQQDIEKGRMSVIDSIDPKEAMKAAAMGALGGELLGWAGDKAGDWAKGKIKTKMASKDLFGDFAKETQEKFLALEEKMKEGKIGKLKKMKEGSDKLKEYEALASDLTPEEKEQFEQYRALKENKKGSLEEYEEYEEDKALDADFAEGAVSEMPDDGGKQYLSDKYIEEITESKSIQDLDDEWKNLGEMNFDAASAAKGKKPWVQALGNVGRTMGQSLKQPFSLQGVADIAGSVARGEGWQDARALEGYKPFMGWDDAGSEAFEIGAGSELLGGQEALLEQLLKQLPPDQAREVYSQYGPLMGGQYY